MGNRAAQTDRSTVSRPRPDPSLAVVDALTIWRRGGSSDDFQAIFLHQMQKLECGAGRTLLADFPFLHCGDARIQQGGKDCLADVRGLADAFDLGRPQRGCRRQAEMVEFAHRYLVNGAGIVKPFCRGVHGLQDLRLLFAHGRHLDEFAGCLRLGEHGRCSISTFWPPISSAPPIIRIDVPVRVLGEATHKYSAPASVGRDHGGLARFPLSRSRDPLFLQVAAEIRLK